MGVMVGGDWWGLVGVIDRYTYSLIGCTVMKMDMLIWQFALYSVQCTPVCVGCVVVIEQRYCSIEWRG